MLIRWLDRYDPVATITGGERVLAGARLFEEGAAIDPRFIYVGQTCDFFPDSASQEVMLACGNDIISVKSDDLNHVFNEVLLAFDFYNDIERRLAAAVLKPKPEQEVVSTCESLLGPTFLMRRDFVIIACSQNFDIDGVNQFWRSFVIDAEPRIESLTFMRSSVINTTILSGKPRMQEFIEPKAHPYSHGIANTYFRYDGEVIGHLIIASDKPITPFERNIAEIMMAALDSIQLNAHVASTAETIVSSGDVLLANLIEGRFTVRNAALLSSMFSLSPEDAYRVVCVEPREKDYPAILYDTLKRSFPESVITETGARFFVLCWGESANAERLKKTCAELRRKAALSFGISNAFVGLEVIPEAAKLSGHALHTESGFFSERAAEFLLHSPDEPLRAYARHPLAIALDRLDSQRGTNLAETMREYLLCERSVKLAAERLFVHKNTVLYRIEQARKLVEVDLDDKDERLYLLLSLMV